MRLKRSRLQTFYHRPMVPRKDNEGSSYSEYGAMEPFQAEEWGAGGKSQIQMYGTRTPNIRNLRLEGTYKEIRTEDGALGFAMNNGPIFIVNDGICMFSGESMPLPSAELLPTQEIFPSGEYAKPDYRIIAIYPYRFLTMELERI